MPTGSHRPEPLGAQDSFSASVSQYRATARLKDGSPVVVRAIRPGDKEALVAGLEHLSPESVYHRFFGIKKRLSEQELVYLTELDFVRHVALAVVREGPDGEEPLGLARYVRVDDGTPPYRAEIAFVTADAWHNRGVASILLSHLTHLARQGGIVAFEAEVLGDNEPMLTVFAHSGLPMTITGPARVRRVVLQVSPAPPT